MARNSQFKKTVFDNGLIVLSERLTQFRSLSMGVWVKVGTRHEALQVAGICHFLEHMLFKGTKNRTALQIAREVDQVGGEFNAFTAREHTCFHILLLDRDYKLGLDILSDVLMHSNFKNEEMERERKVILQEISMVEDSPEELAHDLFFEQVYDQHGLGRPILGSEKSVQRMTRDDLVRFFKYYYQPERLVVSVAGDVSHDEVLRKLRPLSKYGAAKKPGKSKKAGKFGASSKSRAFEVLPTTPEVKSGFWWMERNTEQVHLIWGVKGLNYTSKDRFAAFLLNVYLGGGMSSSLFQEIREKNGLAYTVYSCMSPFEDTGVFSIYVATGINQVALCLKLIEKCVDQLKRKALSKNELRIIQDNLKGTILVSSDNVESRMISIAKNEIFLNKYMTVEEVCQEVDAVTPEDVRRIANFLFKDQQRSVFALGPKPPRRLASQLRQEVPHLRPIQNLS